MYLTFVRAMTTMVMNETHTHTQRDRHTPSFFLRSLWPRADPEQHGNVWLHTERPTGTLLWNLSAASPASTLPSVSPPLSKLHDDGLLQTRGRRRVMVSFSMWLANWKILHPGVHSDADLTQIRAAHCNGASASAPFILVQLSSNVTGDISYHAEAASC